MSKNIKRLIPFAVLIFLIIVVYIANLHVAFNWNWLEKEHMRLRELIHFHPFLSPLVFVIVYTLSVCLVIPDSTILTLLAGLVFPLPLAVAYSVVSEALGALIFYRVFTVVFQLPGLRLKRPMIKRIEQQVSQSPASYMLFVRISHLIPFWTVNVLAAYFCIRSWTFFWTTFLGVIPLTYVLANAAHSLSQQFPMSGQIDMSDIFTTEVKLALLTIGLLMIVPIFLKKWIKRKHL